MIELSKLQINLVFIAYDVDYSLVLKLVWKFLYSRIVSNAIGFYYIIICNIKTRLIKFTFFNFIRKSINNFNFKIRLVIFNIRIENFNIDIVNFNIGLVNFTMRIVNFIIGIINFNKIIIKWYLIKFLVYNNYLLIL